MKNRKIFYLMAYLVSYFFTLTYAKAMPINGLPEDFVYLKDIDESIIESPRYVGKNNFLGRTVPGYYIPKLILTRPAAQALKKVQTELRAQGYSLVVYDTYRPQRAVDAFMAWSKDALDQAGKAFYYPTINKLDAFKLGYIAEKSGHTRGSTADLTIIKLGKKPHAIVFSKKKLLNGEEVPFLDDGTIDMGTSFDLFHEASHHDSLLVSENATKMRNFLRSVMVKHGFEPIKEEWWHYTLVNEPFPDTYFDFVVKEQGATQ